VHHLPDAALESRAALKINDFAAVGISATINANAHLTFVAGQLWIECGLLE
jgi:hypothetical protein